ncbi:ATP-dependent DNA helicase RecG [soil metagenome]
MVALDTPLKSTVGGKTAAALEQHLELRTVRDLLRHYPRRYDERGRLTDLAKLEIGDDVTVMADVRKVTVKKMRSRRGSLLEVLVGDGKRTLTLTFFNQPWRQKELRVGQSGLFAGKVTEFNRVRQLNSPVYELFGDGSGPSALEQFAGSLIPVYPAAADVTSWVIARCVRIVLETLDPPGESLPTALRERHGLVDLGTALHDVHRPPTRDALRAALTRLTWDEAMTLQVTLAQRRATSNDTPGTPRPPVRGGLREAFDARLAFERTAGQREVGEVIRSELGRDHPMHRLLHGEVGSGKTVVALRGMLQTIDAGPHPAPLAPTASLPPPHARSLRVMLGPLARAGELGAADPATRVTLLTGSLGAAARRRALAEAASGTAGIVVGTHALIHEGVEFADLGMVVVDEQHRFGVEQRDALRAKGHRPPHLLVMTATPIPRTVAMTVYGDLEHSSLRELPRGRSPITTMVVPVAEHPAWLGRAWARVREEVAAGHQAYVVCPRIEGDDLGTEDPESAGDVDTGHRPPLALVDVAAMLETGPLSGLALAVLHGRLPAEDKESAMLRFAAGEIDVLVATTVIEVGVDVPNSTVMVVLDADLFGMSHLHQLRGRIGRGAAPGLCLLVTEAPEGSPTRARVDAVAVTADGFELARLDLAARREDDVLGAAQSGRRSQLKLLSLQRHEDLIAEARRDATALVAADPDLREHPALAGEVAVLAWDERAAFLEKA